MRAAFLGSPGFAVPSLKALVGHADIEVTLVVTRPDRPAGRGRALTPPAVKIAAVESGLPVLQPETLRERSALDLLSAATPDVLVVVAYGELLRREALGLAPHGCVNVHPSLLPRYRGATPIPAAILAGDEVTGVTIIRLERRLDAGPILAQRECAINPHDTTGTLGERLAELASEMLPRTLLDLVAGSIEPTAQDDSLASYTRECTADDARIDWTLEAARIERLVRASNPWPTAWSTIDGRRLRIHEAAAEFDLPADSEPGTVDTSSTVPRVATGAGWLRLIAVQPPGKRPMPAGDWLRGARLMSTRFDNV
ncbi:MAG TPA: methionyl-tRNA formyltransferase [Thermomicrobiales bacterium]|nr:methionyl-tRNA formyltransferase [Thermomicrobiales bacterium]